MRVCLPRMKAWRWFAGLAAAVSAVVITGLVPAVSASTVAPTGLPASSGNASLPKLSIVGSAPSAVADAALTRIVDRYSRKLGYPRDVSAAVAGARLPGQLASALAAELSQLYACDLFTRSGVNRLLKTVSPGLPLGFPPVFPFPIQRAGQTVLGLPLLPLLRPPSVTPSATRPGGPIERAIARCGRSVVEKLQEVRDTLAGLGPLQRGGPLDFWPVLRYQPTGGGRTYTHDYVLVVDTGSHNTFANNAGGNMIDIWRGPPGQDAAIVAPARGCIDAFDIIRAQTCVPAAAALLDTGSYNVFGVKTAPDPATDGVCTNSPVEPRVFVQGTGLLGVGVLIDEGSHNTFTGKVLTTGTGHVDGYGYLRVDGSDNRFSVIRFGLGDAVVGGTGTLIVNGSHNTYDYYVPAPKRPHLIPGTYGSGGVVNDLNNCDAGTTLTLGAAEVGGHGVFSATGSNNSYTAPIQSLGFGLVAGHGTFSNTHSNCTSTFSGPGVTGGRGTCKSVVTGTGSFVDS